MSDKKGDALNNAWYNAYPATPSNPEYVSSNIPQNIRNNLAAYKKDDNNETLRNKLFQALYKKDKDLVDKKLGNEEFQGYNGMRQALNEAYGVQVLSDAARTKNGAGNNNAQANPGDGNATNTVPVNNNLPGSNTNSTLAILQRR